MSFSRLRLATQLAILVVASTSIGLLVVILILLSRAQTIVEDAIIARNIQLLESTARQLVEPARQSDIIAARTILGPLPHPGSIRRVALYSANSLFLTQELSRDMPQVSGGGDETLVQQALQTSHLIEQRASNLITLVVPVRVDEIARPVGAVVMELPTNDIQQQWQSLQQTALVVGIVIMVVMGLVAWGIVRYTVGPLQVLTYAASAFGRGELTTPVEIRRGGELGALAYAFRHMAHDLQASRAELEAQNQVLEQRVVERTAEMEQTLVALRESLEMRDQLSAAVHELSSPVVPVLDGILVMPLIGVIDSNRGAMLIPALLRAIEQHGASIVVMDVTGVPIVDTQVAKLLLQAARAAKLLGTQTILVGIRPELAQTIVGLGVDLSDLLTHADLQSGVHYALQQRARHIRDERLTAAWQ